MKGERANHILLAVTLLACISLVTADLKKDKVIVAINCGSDKPHHHSSGVIFSEDKFVKGGIVSDYGMQVQKEWPDLPDMEIYFTERYSSAETLTYELPLRKGSEDGHYVLNLKFSEVYFDNKGRKVFNIALGSEIVVADLDIYSKVGKFSPYDEFIEFDIKQKTLYFKNTPISTAYKADKNVVVVNLMKGARDNPKINGIVLVKGTLEGIIYIKWFRH